MDGILILDEKAPILERREKSQNISGGKNV